MPTVFTQNGDRLLEGKIVTKLFGQVLAQARRRALTSDEHFSVDGTMIEAWASMKSFRPKGTLRTNNPSKNRVFQQPVKLG